MGGEQRIEYPGAVYHVMARGDRRQDIVVRRSEDGGKIWSPPKEIIHPWSSAYSDIAVLPDGRITVLFERENSRAIDIAILPALE